jgi:hypothetical protein
METTKSRLRQVMAALMRLPMLIALTVTRLHLIVANVLLTGDRNKRCTRPVRCSTCV